MRDLAKSVEEGLLTRIIDGDTYDITLRAGVVRARLMGFDAPELGQHGGQFSARVVRRVFLGARVKLGKRRLDQWGRLVCDIWLESGGRMAAALLLCGLGHHDARFTPDKEALRLCELWAKKRKIGIWSKDLVMAPWVWRRIHNRGWLAMRGQNHNRRRGKP